MTTAQHSQKRMIRSHMVRAGLTNTQFAKDAGVSLVYLHQVMIGDRTGYRVRRLLAEKVGVPVEFLFPDTPLKHRQAA